MKYLTAQVGRQPGHQPQLADVAADVADTGMLSIRRREGSALDAALDG